MAGMMGGGSQTMNQSGTQSMNQTSNTAGNYAGANFGAGFIPPTLSPAYNQMGLSLANLMGALPLTGQQGTTGGADLTSLTPGGPMGNYNWGSVGTPGGAQASIPQMVGLGQGGIPLYAFNGQLVTIPEYDSNPAAFMDENGALYSPGLAQYAQPYSGDMGQVNWMPGWGTNVNQGASPDFTKANPQQIAGANPLQTWAAGNVQDLYNTPEAYSLAQLYAKNAVDVAGKPFNPTGVETSPDVLSAQKAFEATQMPMLQNQLSIAGLGRSTGLSNSLALGQSEYMQPVINEAINRQFQQQQNLANLYAGLVSPLTSLGTSDFSQRLQALNAAMTAGGEMRGIEQEPLTAAFNDFLRRQALAEEAQFVPFGTFTPSALGQVGGQSGTYNQTGNVTGTSATKSSGTATMGK